MQNDFIDGVLGSPEAQAIVHKLIENNTVEKWSGDVPLITGGATPIVNTESLFNAKEEE